jgi:hypothetical protein
MSLSEAFASQIDEIDRAVALAQCFPGRNTVKNFSYSKDNNGYRSNSRRRNGQLQSQQQQPQYQENYRRNRENYSQQYYDGNSNSNHHRTRAKSAENQQQFYGQATQTPLAHTLLFQQQQKQQQQQQQRYSATGSPTTQEPFVQQFHQIQAATAVLNQLLDSQTQTQSQMGISSSALGSSQPLSVTPSSSSSQLLNSTWL